MTTVTTSQPIPYRDEDVVEVYLNGAFWDHRSFGTEGEADAFVADPLAADRAKSEAKASRDEAREAEEAKYRAHSMARTSRGRRVAPKPGHA